jgi:hypothetical protein
MTEMIERKIVCDLAEASQRVNNDLDKVEMWTAALGYFQKPVPAYCHGDRYLLPPRQSRAARS